MSSQRRRPAGDESLELGAIAQVIGEPSRARMLSALMDGRALTATELALAADVMPSTASSHLARLRAAALVAGTKQGRHRYFRLASPEIATLLETLMSVAAGPRLRVGPRDPRLRRARSCYDHLAGERAVMLLARLRERGVVRDEGGTLRLEDAGERWLCEIGVDVAALGKTRRPLVCACLDWSERREHLGGAVGAALLARLFELRLVRRDAVGRALTLGPQAEVFIETLALSRSRPSRL